MYVEATRKRQEAGKRTGDDAGEGTTQGRPAPLPAVGNQTDPKPASLVGARDWHTKERCTRGTAQPTSTTT